MCVKPLTYAVASFVRLMSFKTVLRLRVLPGKQITVAGSVISSASLVNWSRLVGHIKSESTAGPPRRRLSGDRRAGMMGVWQTNTDWMSEEQRSTTTDNSQPWTASRRQLRTTMTAPSARGIGYRKLLPSPRQAFLILTLLSTCCPVGKPSSHPG